MRSNYEAVGFIPCSTIEMRYVRSSRYILQMDDRGRPVGYLLHGRILRGSPVVVSQHVIECDHRLRGYGYRAFLELLRRCEKVGASSVQLRVASDLPAVGFWENCRFRHWYTEPGGARRNRIIYGMAYDLEMPLMRLIRDTRSYGDCPEARAASKEGDE